LHTEGTCLRETTSFDVLIVKIGAGGLAVSRRQNPKQKASLTQRTQRVRRA